MISRVLPVPYYTQPTAITCQSTCLKMFGKYLERKQLISSAGANKWIEDIWKEINTGSERPVQARNAYANMVWWLEKYFSPIMFRVEETTDTAKAMQIVRKKN